MLREILPRVSKPGRYLGCEVHAVRKDPAQVRLRVALAFPDVYEVAFSHIGLKILYEILNDREGIWAERVYSPWPDMEAELREHKLPLFALESKDALTDFDLIGFTLQHELTATNILTMLDLAGIPLRSEQRDASHPLIIAGGPAATNPEPVADFIDAFALGDGEELVLQIADCVMEAKSQNLDRPTLLKKLSQLEGVYVPSLYQVQFDSDKRLQSITALHGAPQCVCKATIGNLDTASFIRKPLVPTIQPVHDRYAVEIQRGCTRGCRFCQAGFTYRPVRQRSPERIQQLARDGLACSGQETLGLLSLSAGDYRYLSPLVTQLFEEHSHNRVSINMPSLRVEAITEELVDCLNRENKTGFTLAPEAATERMRRIINKGNTEEDLLDSLKTVFENGWRQVKLYFMIGLPTETDDDVLAIAELAKKARQIGRTYAKSAQVTVSVSSFVPKAHTPFQWANMLPEKEIRRRQMMLRDQLKAYRIGFKYHHSDATVLEGALARGDRRLGRVIEAAFRKGARFDAWTDQLDIERWRESFAEFDFDINAYAEREFNESDVLPWVCIDYGVTPEYLWEEYQQALGEQARPDCAYDLCQLCGICDHDRIERRVFAPEGDSSLKFKHVETAAVKNAEMHSFASPNGVRVVRFQYHKQGYAVFLGHLDVMNQVARAFRRAAVPVKYSEGFRPKPCIGFSQALPLGVASKAEYFDAELLDAMPVSVLVERLNRNLPLGISIVDARQISSQTRSLSESIASYRYCFDLSRVCAAERVEQALLDFNNAESIPVLRSTKKGTHQLDAKLLVSALRLESEGVLSADFAMDQVRAMKPSEFLCALFDFTEAQLSSVIIEKTGVQFATPKKIQSSEKQTIEKIKNFSAKERRNGPKANRQRHSIREPGGTG